MIIITIVFLLLRYAIVSIGVMFFPLAIFAYFIPPIRSYGSLILNFLGTCMFVTFLDAIILVGFGKLIEIPAFANMKMLIMISAFSLINSEMFFLMFFSIIKAGYGAVTKISSVVATIGALVA